MKLGKQQGFTLIELVMVIVILGILAAVALPKFADLGGDAKRAKLQGALGSVRSASAIIHSKALIDGTSASASSTVTVEGGTVATVYGFPASTAIATAAGLSATDYTITESSGTTTIKPTSSTCAFTYAQATASSATPPVITPPAISDISGC
jgi:MSHA pilin protein MshA